MNGSPAANSAGSLSQGEGGVRITVYREIVSPHLTSPAETRVYPSSAAQLTLAESRKHLRRRLGEEPPCASGATEYRIVLPKTVAPDLLTRNIVETLR